MDSKVLSDVQTSQMKLKSFDIFGKVGEIQLPRQNSYFFLISLYVHRYYSRDSPKLGLGLDLPEEVRLVVGYSSNPADR